MLSIHNDTHMRGRLVAAGRVVLDSWFEGDVLCSKLEIGPNGYVLGSVIAREVIAEGQIVGPVTAGRVSLLAGAFVEGDIETSRLDHAKGATQTGSARFVADIPYPAELLAMETRAAEDRALSPTVSRTPVRRPARRPGQRLLQFPLRRATRVMSV